MSDWILCSDKMPEVKDGEESEDLFLVVKSVNLFNENDVFYQTFAGYIQGSEFWTYMQGNCKKVVDTSSCKNTVIAWKPCGISHRKFPM